MKGIILAGGMGTRLFPLTLQTSKQLLPVYDKPMIYYPLSTLMLGGIKDIAIISTPEHINLYEDLLGDGNHLGIKLTYVIQEKPRGLADAFIVCEDFIEDDNVALILGDNIFYGNMRIGNIIENFDEGALIFGYAVENPKRYGVVEVSEQGEIVSIEEKPIEPKSNLIVPGLYIYDNNVVKYSKSITPSKRGELEITDLNLFYLSKNELNFSLLGRGVVWFDVGTYDSLQIAGEFIKGIQNQQKYKIGCIEEVAIRKEFLPVSKFETYVNNLNPCDYKDYLLKINKEIKQRGFDKQNILLDYQD